MGGDTKALGRIGTRAVAWFIVASIVSLTLGCDGEHAATRLSAQHTPPPAEPAPRRTPLSISRIHHRARPAIDPRVDGEQQHPPDRRLLRLRRVALAAVGERGKPLVRA
jgi:hypothetical protein